MQNVDTASEATVAEARRNLDLMRGIALRSKDLKDREEDEVIFTSVYATHAWKSGAVLECVPIMRTPAKDEQLLPEPIRKLLVAWPPVTEGEKQWSIAYGYYAFYRVAPNGAEGANVRYEPRYDEDFLNIVATRGLFFYSLHFLSCCFILSLFLFLCVCLSDIATGEEILVPSKLEAPIPK